MQAMTEKVKRRLTTVLCADVHGYSRLMEADEAGTLATLHRCRTAIAGLVERHDGRIVNTWGDAVIAEFGSVVEAVQCAVEIQQELSDPDPDRPDAQRMWFRIGINLGDIIVDGSDIYGDGVNIAARLQELAEPGDILVSGSVYDQVYNKLSIAFDCLGRKQVKNIASPVMSYRVTRGGEPPGGPGSRRAERARPQADAVAASEAVSPSPPATHDPSRRRRSVSTSFANLPRPVAAILVLAGFLVVINVFTGLDEIWFHWPIASLLLIATLWKVLRRKASPVRKDERRTGRE
jgi:adenylate cyclase